MNSHQFISVSPVYNSNDFSNAISPFLDISSTSFATTIIESFLLQVHKIFVAPNSVAWFTRTMMNEHFRLEVNS